MGRKIKIGIDVGGTFTHAVAVDISNYEIVGKSRVPTTHRAKEGVARGVIESLWNLIEDSGIDKNEIILIAHSTTQATNALLEGDVANVGIFLIGKGVEGEIAKKQVTTDSIELTSGKSIKTFFTYFDTQTCLKKEKIKDEIERLVNKGVNVFIVSEVFGVDDPTNEEFVVKIASELGYLATAASSITKLYGFHIRTRTAIVNASMLPKMLETANMTEKAVRESGINAPIMIMRSDGGIMDINEMRRRPILTILSGPAAGVAAALMYVKISDGIFIDVGGTSTDISVVKNGRLQVKNAQIAGNKLFLKTLDVRTMGIAGGSMLRLHDSSIVDVGPRSAHIADLSYISFSNTYNFNDIELKNIRPLDGDPDNYVKVSIGKDITKNFAITPTDAAIFLEYDNGLINGNKKAINSFFSTLSKFLNRDKKEIADKILSISSNKLKPTIRRLIKEYKLNPDYVKLIGGGGGAPALVPYTAKKMGLQYQIAENYEIISSIGAALGIIRDTVEKSIINPTEDDIIYIRQQALESVQSMGADPDSIEVTIEIDSKNKRLIAIATGSTELRTKDIGIKTKSESELLDICAQTLRANISNLNIVGKTSFLTVVMCKKEEKHYLGLLKKKIKIIQVIDREGVIRLQLNDCFVTPTVVKNVKNAISKTISELTTYGDAGALLPDIFILVSSRITDLTGLTKESQIISIAEIEMKKFIQDEPAVILSIKNR